MNLRKFAAKVARKASKTCEDVAGRLDPRMPGAAERRSAPWFAADGDRTLRLNYELNSGSVVFDVGSYKGEWATIMAAMYGCCIHVFEPVSSFALQLSEKFKHNPAIKVHYFGLSGRSRMEQISVDENRSSTFPGASSPAKVETVELMDVSEFLQQYKITAIDLMKINIEGGEYELLERMIERAIVELVGDIQVQFHDFIPDARERLESIRAALERTHRLTYCYDFVWENWRLRSLP